MTFTSACSPATTANIGYVPNCGLNVIKWVGSVCMHISAPVAYVLFSLVLARSRVSTSQSDSQMVAVTNKLANWPAATSLNQNQVGAITYLVLVTGF